MKIFVGILSVLIILALGIIGVLAVWGIYPVSWEIIWKSGITLLLVSVTFAVLWLVVTLFLKREKYNENGNNAHRMN